jgi:hypothetical protein
LHKIEIVVPYIFVQLRNYARFEESERKAFYKKMVELYIKRLEADKYELDTLKKNGPVVIAVCKRKGE